MKVSTTIALAVFAGLLRPAALAPPKAQANAATPSGIPEASIDSFASPPKELTVKEVATVGWKIKDWSRYLQPQSPLARAKGGAGTHSLMPRMSA